MKRLKSVENEQVQLEVLECDCGFHMGLDATFFEQVGDFAFTCPSCDMDWHTALVFPENHKKQHMELYIDGKTAVMFKNDLLVVFEQGDLLDEEQTQVHLKVTHEGIIVDRYVRDNDNVMGTCCYTWDELEELCH